jgi:hypothetical protein
MPGPAGRFAASACRRPGDMAVSAVPGRRPRSVELASCDMVSPRLPGFGEAGRSSQVLDNIAPSPCGSVNWHWYYFIALK